MPRPDIDRTRCVKCGTVDQFTDGCSRCNQRCCRNCSCEHQVQRILTSIHELKSKLAIKAPDPNTQLTNWVAFQEKNKKEQNESDEKMSNLIISLEIMKDKILQKYKDFDRYAQEQIASIQDMDSIWKVLEGIEASLAFRENCVGEIKTAVESFKSCNELATYVPKIEHVPKSLETVMTRRLEWEVDGMGSQIFQRKVEEKEHASLTLKSQNEIFLFKLNENTATFQPFAKGKMSITRTEGLYELRTINENGEEDTLLHWNNEDRTCPRYEARPELVSWSLQTAKGQQIYAAGASRPDLYNFCNALDHIEPPEMNA